MLRYGSEGKVLIQHLSVVNFSHCSSKVLRSIFVEVFIIVIGRCLINGGCMFHCSNKTTYSTILENIIYLLATYIIPNQLHFSES